MPFQFITFLVEVYIIYPYQTSEKSVYPIILSNYYPIIIQLLSIYPNLHMIPSLYHPSILSIESYPFF